MFRKLVVLSFGFALIAMAGLSEAAQDKKKRTGTVTGELKSRKDTPNGKNSLIEVLAAGEEKARQYRVMFDQKTKGPIPEVLEKVRAATVGDRVTMDWIDTGEGLAITSFQVLKKSDK